MLTSLLNDKNCTVVLSSVLSDLSLLRLIARNNNENDLRLSLGKNNSQKRQMRNVPRWTGYELYLYSGIRLYVDNLKKYD